MLTKLLTPKEWRRRCSSDLLHRTLRRGKPYSNSTLHAYTS